MAKKRKKQKHKKKKIARPELLKQASDILQTQIQSVKKESNKIKKRRKKEEKKEAAKPPKPAKSPRKPLLKFLHADKQAKKKEKKVIITGGKPVQEKPAALTVPAAVSAPSAPSSEAKKTFKDILKIKISRDLRKPIIIVFTVIGLFVIFALSSVIITLELAGKAMPGTRIAGINAGFLTIDEIQNKLMEKGQPFLDDKIQLSMDGAVHEFAAKELGISLDPRRSIQDVEFIEFGKSNLFNIIYGLIQPKEVPYYVSIDINSALKNIETKFNFAEKKSSNAYLAFEEDVLVIVPEKQGKAIDVRSLYLDIKKNANSLSSSPITIKLIDDSPLVTKEKLESEIDGIKETLKNKIALNYENFSYTVKLIDHIDWVKFDYKDVLKIGDAVSLPIILQQGESANLTQPLSVNRTLWISIQNDPFAAWVNEEIAPDLEAEPQDVEIYKDENGDIKFNGLGENGRKILEPFLISALAEAVNNGISDVTIPVQEKKAQVKTSQELQDMGIKTLIATGRSGFAGSPTNRIHNINVGINTYNGILIEPGETFSFNDHLGPVDASTGYRTELVIKAEGTVPEYGGGLCQVSSTMYRAALFAGLPIVERAPHSYAVSYYAQIYGYGMDSTIYPGVHDLKFINDTPGYILVQSYTDGAKAFYKFYGTDDGRKVTMEGPYTYGYHSPGPATIVESPNMAPGARKQVEIAHTGFNATWYRYITKNGETVKERIESAYRAIPAKIMVGPSAAPAESAPEAPAQ